MNPTTTGGSGRSDSLNWFSWNCQTLQPDKIQHLEGIVNEQNVHVILLQETKLTKSKMPELAGYNLVSVGYRRRTNPDKNLRRQDHKTDVAIYVDSNLTATKADFVLPRDCESSSCSAEVYLKSNNNAKPKIYHFTSVYCPNGVENSDIPNQLKSLDESKNEITYIVSGDFNDHAKAWSNLPHAQTDTRLSQAIAESPLVILNDGNQTRIPQGAHVGLQRPSAIDLTFASRSLGGSTWTVLTESMFRSDHVPIYCSASLSGDLDGADEEVGFNMDKADWMEFQKILDKTKIKYLNNMTINNQYEAINKAIYEAADSSIPLRKQRPGYRKAAWWDETCQEAKEEVKFRSFVLYKNLTQENLVNLRKAEMAYTKTISVAKLRDWEKTLSEEVIDYRDSKVLWRKIKRIRQGRKPTKRPLIVIDKHGNKHRVVDEKQKADLLAETIAGKSRNEKLDEKDLEFRENFERTYVDPAPNNNLDFNQPITRGELEQAIKDVRDKNKAAGADKVTYRMIEKLPDSFKVVVLEHFNACFRRGVMPDKWKKAQVFTLLKEGKDPTNPDSYRPISLTPHMGKLFEKIIKARLERHLEVNNVIPSCQSGFRHSRSTTDNLVLLTELMKNALRNTNSGRYLIMFPAGGEADF